MDSADKQCVKHKASCKQFDSYFTTFRLKTRVYGHDSEMRADLKLSNLVINRK